MICWYAHARKNRFSEIKVDGSTERGTAVSAASRGNIYDIGGRHRNCDGWNNLWKIFNFFWRGTPYLAKTWTQVQWIWSFFYCFFRLKCPPGWPRPSNRLKACLYCSWSSDTCAIVCDSQVYELDRRRARHDVHASWQKVSLSHALPEVLPIMPQALRNALTCRLSEIVVLSGGCRAVFLAVGFEYSLFWASFAIFVSILIGLSRALSLLWSFVLHLTAWTFSNFDSEAQMT